ncbi:MAG: glycosyltransferase, partial [Patescibacteria group bacterium]
EWFTGRLDVFWSSDWTQPPLMKAAGITTIHDLTVIRYPETFAKKIVDVHRRRLQWVARECKKILCDSEATKNDVITLLGIPQEKLHVVYPGFI